MFELLVWVEIKNAIIMTQSEQDSITSDLKEQKKKKNPDQSKEIISLRKVIIKKSYSYTIIDWRIY